MSVETTNLTRLNVETGTATSTAGAATINAQTGVITTEALTTAVDAAYTMTLTNSLITANSVVLVTVGKGTASQGNLTPCFVTPTTGSATMLFVNVGTTLLNGTVKIGFKVENVA